jgi:dTDP-4-dehydrorhamnose 3,5-epimerase
VKLLDVKPLAIPEIRVIRFARFRDERGYFTEIHRRSDFQSHPLVPFMKGVDFQQANESFSRKGTVRGLHFQWNPYMGKLVRTVYGHMVDLVLDIRKGSSTLGKIIAYDMPSHSDRAEGEWIWVPPGFAHGNFYPQESLIEYFCSGEYSPGCEAGISPLAPDIDWTLCANDLRQQFLAICQDKMLITDKDRDGFSLTGWNQDSRSDLFRA